MRFLLDTAVLVYAVGDAEHPLAAPASAVIARAAANPGLMTTTPEVIQGFLHVRSRRRTRIDAVNFARAFAEVLAPLVEVNADDVHLGMELYLEHSKLGAFDAMLAGVAANRSDVELVSPDRAFQDVDGLVVRDLASFE